MSVLTAQDLIGIAIARTVILFDATRRGEHVEESICPLQVWRDNQDKLSECFWVDAINEERDDYINCSLPEKKHSRHYKVKRVVKFVEWKGVKYAVAYHYFYNGEKYFRPEGFDWISDAEIVDYKSKEITTTVFEFSERGEG